MILEAVINYSLFFISNKLLSQLGILVGISQMYHKRLTKRSYQSTNLEGKPQERL